MSNAKVRLLDKKYERTEVPKEILESLKRVNHLNVHTTRLIDYITSAKKYQLEEADRMNVAHSLRMIGEGSRNNNVGAYFNQASETSVRLQGLRNEFRGRAEACINELLTLTNHTFPLIKTSFRDFEIVRDAYDDIRKRIKAASNVDEMNKLAGLAEKTKKDIDEKGAQLDDGLKKLPEYEAVITKTVSEYFKIESECAQEYYSITTKLIPPTV